MAWRIYSQTVLFLKRIREQFRNLLHQPRQYSRLLDYTALLEQLIQQNKKQQELMETLVKENKKLEQDIKNIQNAMPAMMCMLGVIIGVLLLHILASYIRP